jgi:hypothetical protein
MSLDSPEGNHRFVIVESTSKPRKSLSEAEAKRISKIDAANLLFMVRE